MYKAVCIVPARGGSRRVPLKNLAPLGGLPLIAHTLFHATTSVEISETFVSTDHDGIASVAVACGARAIARPSELTGDEVSSDAVLLHTLDVLRAEGREDPEYVVMLQCTAPLRRAHDVDAAVRQMTSEGADSLLSVCPNHSFLWTLTPDGPQPQNYDLRHRPLSQNFKGQFVENGSIYVVRTSLLRDTKCRLGGRISLYVMDGWSAVDIDLPTDLERAEYCMATWPDSNRQRCPEALERLRQHLVRTGCLLGS